MIICIIVFIPIIIHIIIVFIVLTDTYLWDNQGGMDGLSG